MKHCTASGKQKNYLKKFRTTFNKSWECVGYIHKDWLGNWTIITVSSQIFRNVFHNAITVQPIFILEACLFSYEWPQSCRKTCAHTHTYTLAFMQNVDTEMSPGVSHWAKGRKTAQSLCQQFCLTPTRPLSHSHWVLTSITTLLCHLPPTSNTK